MFGSGTAVARPEKRTSGGWHQHTHTLGRLRTSGPGIPHRDGADKARLYLEGAAFVKTEPQNILDACKFHEIYLHT